MHYSLLLHSGVKCYGAVSMHPQMQLPLHELLPPADSAPINLRSLLIHQRHTKKYMHFLPLFVHFSPVHLCISFSVWLKLMVASGDELSALGYLTVRNIPLSSDNSNNSSFALSNSEYARSILYYVFLLQKNVFSECYSCIKRIDLYFEDACSDGTPGSLSLSPEMLSKLFMLSSLLFFDALDLHLHLPDSYCLDPSSALFSLFSLFSSSAPFAPFAPAVSADEVEALLNSLTLPSNCHSISMSREVHTLSRAERICIQLRDLYWMESYKKGPSTLFLQQLCSSLLQHNLLLTPPSIRTITFHTGSQTHTLTVPNDLAVLNISFEKSKQSLCFRRLHWMG